MRVELAWPGPQILAADPRPFKVMVTAHGMIMIVFVLMPALIVASMLAAILAPAGW